MKAGYCFIPFSHELEARSPHINKLIHSFPSPRAVSGSPCSPSLGLDRPTEAVIVRCAFHLYIYSHWAWSPWPLTSVSRQLCSKHWTGPLCVPLSAMQFYGAELDDEASTVVQSVQWAETRESLQECAHEKSMILNNSCTNTIEHSFRSLRAWEGPSAAQVRVRPEVTS